MENEIEKLYLIGKLDELINEVKDSNKRCTSQTTQLFSKFQTLKATITPSSSAKLTKEQLYNLNNLLSEWQSKQASLFSVDSLNIITPKFVAALDNILKEFSHETSQSVGETRQDVSVPHPQTEGETRQDDVSVPHPQTPHSEDVYKWSNQYVDEKSVFGTNDKEVFLRGLIIPQNQPLEKQKDSVVFRGFGLVGMRGIGKTTLAQMVFNHSDIRSHFLPRVWVCMSKQPGDDPDPRKETVKRALRSLGVEDEIIAYADEKHQLKGLLYALRQQLLGRRYLIVLDDVCIEEKYYDFVSSLEKNVVHCEETMAYGLPKECGGAVIVTSRHKEIAKKIVGEENLHRVLPLSGKDCWEIFKNTIKEEGDSASKNMENMEKLENKITEKCHGLPLAAKMMGEIARKPKPIPTTTTNNIF